MSYLLYVVSFLNIQRSKPADPFFMTLNTLLCQDWRIVWAGVQKTVVKLMQYIPVVSVSVSVCACVSDYLDCCLSSRGVYPETFHLKDTLRHPVTQHSGGLSAFNKSLIILRSVAQGLERQQTVPSFPLVNCLKIKFFWGGLKE